MARRFLLIKSFSTFTLTKFLKKLQSRNADKKTFETPPKKKTHKVVQIQPINPHSLIYYGN